MLKHIEREVLLTQFLRLTRLTRFPFSRSTDYSVVDFTTHEAFECKLQVHVVYTDFSKAFDRGSSMCVYKRI